MGLDKCLLEECYDELENQDFSLLHDDGVDCLVEECLGELEQLDTCEQEQQCTDDHCMECRQVLGRIRQCYDDNNCGDVDDDGACLGEHCLAGVMRLSQCLKNNKEDCFSDDEDVMCEECVPLENAAKHCVLVGENDVADCEYLTKPYDRCMDHCEDSHERVMFGHGGSPWFKACANGDVEGVKAMLMDGAHVDEQQTGTGMTCALYAIKNGHMLVLNLVADKEASCYVANHNGDTALHLAARSNKKSQHRMVRKVLECDQMDQTLLDMPNNMGQTALTAAARQVDGALAVAALVEAGANVNVMENDGDTAALVAFKNNALLSLEVLLKHGVDLTYQGKRWKNNQRFAPHLTYLVVQKMKNTHKDLSKFLEIIVECAVTQGQDVFTLEAPNGMSVIDLCCSDPLLHDMVPHMVRGAQYLGVDVPEETRHRCQELGASMEMPADD